MTYLFSNIRITRPEVVLDNIQEGDTLVFINRANNYELFKDVKARKVLVCRVNCYEGGYHGREEWKGRELNYFDEFYIAEKLMDYKEVCPEYPQGKIPTTGCWLYLYYTRVKKEKVVLVNFFPAQDIGTRWSGHCWNWEDELYKKENATIIDLR